MSEAVIHVIVQFKQNGHAGENSKLALMRFHSE